MLPTRNHLLCNCVGPRWFSHLPMFPAYRAIRAMLRVWLLRQHYLPLSLLLFSSPGSCHSSSFHRFTTMPISSVSLFLPRSFHTLLNSAYCPYVFPLFIHCLSISCVSYFHHFLQNLPAVLLFQFPCSIAILPRRLLFVFVLAL